MLAGLCMQGGNRSNSTSILAQEFANLLRKAISTSQSVHRAWRTEEAWIISIRGTEVRLVTALFKRHYLASANSTSMDTHQRLVVFRSQPYSLKRREERQLALKAIFALCSYMKSGSGMDDYIGEGHKKQ